MHISIMLVFWFLLRNSVVLAVYLLFSVACFFTVHEHSVVECFENVIEIEAVSGDNHLGGDDVDQLLYKDFMEKHSELSLLDEEGAAGLRTALTEAKCALGKQDKLMVSYTYGTSTVEDYITQEQLLELGLPILERIRHLCAQAMRDAKCKENEIDDVIMVGGSSQLYFVQRFIEELFDRPPVVMDKTDKVVARGAGIYAGIRMRAADIKDRMMTDVCPFTLGTNVVWDKEDDRPHICPVLERNCPLPFSKTIQLYTTGDYQELMRVGIYQGEAYYADENVCLGELLIGVRRRLAGQEGIRVTFSYDINGVLQVEAENAMHQVVKKLIVNDALSEKEIEESLIQLEQLKMPDKETEEYALIHAKLEWLYQQQTGTARNQTAGMLYHLKTTREEGKHHLYVKVKEEAKQWLVQASMYLDAFEPEN